MFWGSALYRLRWNHLWKVAGRGISATLHTVCAAPREDTTRNRQEENVDTKHSGELSTMNAMLDQILQGPNPQAATDYYQIIGCDETANVSACRTAKF